MNITKKEFSQLNEETTGYPFTIKLAYLDEDHDKSVWNVTFEESVHIFLGSLHFTMPAGTVLTVEGCYDDTEEEMEKYIDGRGILTAAGLNERTIEKYIEEE